MTTQGSPYPRVDFLIDTFTDWLKHRRELNEMRLMDRGDFDRIAADLEISPAISTNWSAADRTRPTNCRSS